MQYQCVDSDLVFSLTNRASVLPNLIDSYNAQTYVRAYKHLKTKPTQELSFSQVKQALF